MADPQYVDFAELQALLDEFSRRVARLKTVGIPWDEALRHVVNDGGRCPCCCHEVCSCDLGLSLGAHRCAMHEHRHCRECE